MAFEYLDLENKMYVPTKQLLNQIQIDLLGLYENIRQNLITAHDKLAVAGKEFYDAPLETLTRSYDQAVVYGIDFYAGFFEKFLPQAEANYREILAMTTDWAGKTREGIEFAIENPEQITAEAIQSITDDLTTAGNVSMELVDELQEKTAAIVTLLLDQPWQTLSSASMELLNNLLNGYFELVSSLLTTM